MHLIRLLINILDINKPILWLKEIYQTDIYCHWENLVIQVQVFVLLSTRKSKWKYPQKYMSCVYQPDFTEFQQIILPGKL